MKKALGCLFFINNARVFINNCSIKELMSVPGIGAKGADKILELREAKGGLELDDLNQLPHLRITPQLLDCLDFTSLKHAHC
jgi:predicted DNA-binding helix-hairpin-helix protein